jgi:hypothetical protein
LDFEKRNLHLRLKRLFPFEFLRSPLNQTHSLGDHFQIRPGAGDLEPAVQTFGPINTETRHRFFRNRLYIFPLYLFWGNVGLRLFFPRFHICGCAGLCVLAGAASLESGDDFSR